MVPPTGVFLLISKLHSISAVAVILAHNITIRYYVQVNSMRIKSNLASKWASKHLWGTIYFAVDGTFYIYVYIINSSLKTECKFLKNFYNN